MGTIGLPTIPISEEVKTLLSCFDLCRNQTNTVDHVSAPGDIDDLSHVLKFNVRIALDKHHALGTRFKDVRETG